MGSNVLDLDTHSQRRVGLECALGRVAGGRCRLDRILAEPAAEREEAGPLDGPRRARGIVHVPEVGHAGLYLGPDVQLLTVLNHLLCDGRRHKAGYRQERGAADKVSGGLNQGFRVSKTTMIRCTAGVEEVDDRHETS